MPEQQTNSNDEIINIGGNASAKLKNYIERVENLQVEIDERKEDQKEVYLEARSIGLDDKIIKKAVARRKKEREKVLNEDALLATYEKAIGEQTLEDMLG